ncbi:MAG: DUF5060 domain-containing protein, partial [Myxococcota bacterium]|nr:DUF5060 domain-containing protein [Myxococcota bacterium]
MHRTSLLACLLVLGIALIAGPASAGEVRGELAQWHEIEVWFRGPAHAESDSGPNPFLDYRLQCLFRGPSGQTYDVPGFFDTDGAGGQSGDVWVCRFSPDEEGAWSYQASFRQGSQVAVSLDAGAGSATAFDGDAGVFAVGPSAASGRDFRSPERGLLTNVGDHYLTFAGSGGAWVKGAIDVPENFFGYEGFDNTPAARHAFPGHAGDWRPGDPDWGNGDGRAIIGAINYLAETGANGFYFLPMNVGGDGKDTYPTLAPQDKTHYDTSKLRQWNVVLGHAQSLGVFVHFQLAETESGNENYHDGGQLGPQRKLYYRELIARFGHHPGIQFDLGEENDYGTNRRRVFAAHLKALDPYDHPVTTHIHTNQMESFYGPLLGNDDFDMTAFQINSGGFDQGDAVTEWRTRSAAAGAPWVVSIDEPQKIENDPNDAQNGYPHGRTNFLWPTYLSGGGGFEWYIQEDGGGHSFDQRIEDLREADVALRWTGHALDFLAELPLLDMEPLAALGRSSAGGRTYVLAIPGDVYALYHPKGGSLELDLRGHDGLYTVEWFHPRNGTWQPGPTLTGGVWVELGQAPFGGDAAALVTREGDAPNEAPVASFSVTPSTGEAPLAVRLDASGSTDDSTVVDYDWTLGDGATPAGPIVDHVFTAPGVYVVRLEVTDDEGARAMASREVVATDPTPDPDPTPGPDPTPDPDPTPGPDPTP